MPQEIDIPDLPKEYVAVRYDKVIFDSNEPAVYVFDKGAVRAALISDNGAYMLQVKQLRPKRLVLEQTSEIRKIMYLEWFEDATGNLQQWRMDTPTPIRYRYWQVVNEEK